MKLSASLFAVILPLGLADAARAQISLEEAVETPGLSWVTGGSKPWQALLDADAKSGGDLARCGLMSNGQFFWGGIDVTGWMETELTGPGTFRIFVRSNFNPYLETSLSVDGVVVESMEMDFDWRGGMTPWQVLSCPLPAGRHTVRLTACLGCGGAGTIPLDDPTIEADLAAVLPPAPGAAEALDAPQVTWLTGGDPGYSPVNDVTHDGTDALHSPAQSGSSWLQTEIVGPATVSWWRKGSAVVSIEGLAVSSIPFAEWTRESAFVPPGKHQVRWSNVANDVWLDEFTAGAESPVKLAEAVDAPGRVFTASHGWQGHTSTTAPDGVDFAWTKTSGEPQWMETTVVGPALVESRWRVRGVGGDFQVLVDGQMVTSGYGLNAGENSGSSRLIVPPGSHVVRWQVSPRTWENTGSLVMLDEVKVGPASPQSLDDVLDAPELTWTTGGDAPWLGLASGEAADGVDLAYSPALTGQQSAWLETTVTGPGSLSFNWKTLAYAIHGSSRRVWVDNQVIRENSWNRSGDWQGDAVEVPPGIHRIRWEVSGPGGAGAMLVDDVRWLAAGTPPVAAALDFIPTALYADEGWSTDTAVHTDGVDSLRMEPVDGYPGNSIVMLVNGPALLTLKTRSVEALLRLSTAGHEVQSTSNEWTTLTVYVASGWRPVYLNSRATYASGVPERASWVDAVTVTSSAVPLAEALGTPGRVWLTNPANPWGGTNGSVTAGPANPNATSWLETTVTGPAVVSFAASGFLELLMNGSLHSTVNSAADYGYQSRRLWVPPGTHTLRWSDSLNSQQLVALSAVRVSAMSAAPSLSRVGDTVHFTIPRPAGYTDSNIQIESSTSLTGGFYRDYGATVRSNDAELVISLPISPGTPRLFVRAKFLP